MKSIILKAPAKINLFLFVGDTMPDGYHEIFSLFTRISLFDEITISPHPEKKLLIEMANHPEIEIEKNTIYRIWRAFNEATGIEKGYNVELKKNIPSMSGLGGGSSDAASFLKFLNESSGNPLNFSDLTSLATSVGSDIPFFLYDSPCLSQGRGEKLIPVLLPENLWATVIIPDFGISTSWAYSQVKNDLTCSIKRNIFSVFGSCRISFDDFVRASWLFDNSFRLVLEGLNSFYVENRRIFLDSSSFMALPSGSGSSMFGLFKSREQAENALNCVSFSEGFVVSLF
jgi:4-diphosphocytidyl-2-C-methyl-D-erythritol kinase